MTRKLRLGAFLPAPGHHIAAWRHPRARADGGHSFSYYLGLAKTAEQGLFDLIFLSDGVGIRTHYSSKEELAKWGRMVHFEPLTLLSALAVCTRHIGLVATASTTYNEPFHIARKFASLDHLSNGRSGWNIVTSVTDAEAQNFNRSRQPEHAARYQRAEEFVTVAKGLWNSWQDDAFIYDKERGQFFDPEKLSILDHRGEHFQVRGPLNVARSPQGMPVLVQAGSSPTGVAFASRHAEVVFTAQQTLSQARAYYKSVKTAAAKAGRDSSQLVIMPGLFPVVAESKAAAEDLFQELQSGVDLEAALGLLADRLGGVDVSTFDLDKPLPALAETQGSISRQMLIIEKAQEENLTVRELALKIAGGRGHCVAIGTPDMIADHIEEWFTGGGCDGFNVMPPMLPSGLEDFVRLVVPELQRRGLHRRAYESTMLRGHLGLNCPNHGKKAS